MSGGAPGLGYFRWLTGVQNHELEESGLWILDLALGASPPEAKLESGVWNLDDHPVSGLREAWLRKLDFVILPWGAWGEVWSLESGFCLDRDLPRSPEVVRDAGTSPWKSGVWSLEFGILRVWESGV